MFIRYLAPFSFSLILSACGGGSSSSSTEPVVLDKYDADTYSPKVVSQGSLEGAWLYVMKFDLSYRQDDFDPDASVRFGVEMRTIVNLVETETGLEIHNPWNWCSIASAISETASPSERCFSDPDKYASNEGGVLTLDLGHGEFIGSINSENNRVIGQVYPYSENDLNDMHTVVHSSQGGMIKLSDIPSLPNLSETPSTWGVIDYSETESLSLHSFLESTMLVEYIESGEVVGTEQIYSLKAASIQALNSAGLPASMSYSVGHQFGFAEYIQAEVPAEYSEGWYASILKSQLITSPSMSGLDDDFNGPNSSLDHLVDYSSLFWGEDIQDQAPLVSTSDVSEIVGNVSATQTRIIEMNGSFIADGEETFTVDIFVDLQ